MLYQNQLKVFICIIKLKHKTLQKSSWTRRCSLSENCTIVQSVKDSIKVTETIELISKTEKRENTALTFFCFREGSMMECLGCKLANEEEKIYRVYEDEYVTCF